MAVSDYAPPLWLKVGNQVDWKGLILTITEIKEVPSPEKYWADRGVKELYVGFEGGRHKLGWHGLKPSVQK